MSAISIDGRRIAYEIAGSGPVTVILETGIGAESAEWASVAAALAAHARVLTYDRAGRGASDRAEGPRHVRDLRADLDALIDATGLAPPFLVVGHSFGGVLARAFARERPRDVCGVVLVESMHPRQFEVLGPLFPDPDDARPKAHADMSAFWHTSWKETDSTPEHIDLMHALGHDRVAAGSLGDLPVRVVSAASFLSASAIADDATRRALQSRWNALQAEFHALSNATEAVYLEQCGHFVQREQPHVLAKAALDLIAMHR